MAKYFRFHSVEEIEAESHRLGLGLRFQDDLTPLFQPCDVGPLKVGNRLCIQPMEGCDAAADGSPDELVYRRYRRFGAGGAKLLWGEATAVFEEARANPRQLWIHEGNVGAFARIVEECQREHRAAMGDDSDMALGLQLTHSGRYCYRRPMIAQHDPVLDERTVVDKTTGRTVDGTYPLLTDDELRRIPEAYAQAARRAYDAGFQFVDIKQCHRYLLNELLASFDRPGPFGGSYENRTRLAREIFQAIRAAAPKLVLAARLNAFDGVPYRKRASDDAGEQCPLEQPRTLSWGTAPKDPDAFEPDEPVRWVRDMAKLGVAIVNISIGNPYASPHLIRPFETPPPDGYETPEHPLIGVDRHFRIASKIQEESLGLPIVGSGYSYLQEFFPQAGAANVATGRITFVGVGRGALSQPDFAKQLLDHGKLDRKRICRTFSYCTALMRSKHNDAGQFPTGCPPFDKDVYGPLWELAKKK